MADLNLDVNYFDHIKTRKLVDALGKGSEVLPIKLWCYTAKHYAKDGKLAGHTPQDIESAIGWWGTSGECVKKMVDFHFLDLKRGSYFVHNWLTRSGHLAAAILRAKAGAKARWDKFRSEKNGDAQEMLGDAQAELSNAPNPLVPLVPLVPSLPTSPTNPTQPPRGANSGGSGDAAHREGVGKNGSGRAAPEAGNVGDAGRVVAVQSILAGLKINPETVRKLMIRRDVTVDRIKHELADIRRDPGVVDVPAVLVGRLTKSGANR